MKLILAFAAVSLMWASTALGADKSSGCGMGWYVFKKNSLVSSVLRSTTNTIFWNNTFGMTSGTSNCAKHSIVQDDKKDIHFLEANYHTLLVDSAVGDSSFLTAFAEALGCQGAGVDGVKDLLRHNYQEIFHPDTTDFVGTLSRIRTLMNAAPLANHCGASQVS